MATEKVIKEDGRKCTVYFCRLKVSCPEVWGHALMSGAVSWKGIKGNPGEHDRKTALGTNPRPETEERQKQIGVT